MEIRRSAFITPCKYALLQKSIVHAPVHKAKANTFDETAMRSLNCILLLGFVAGCAPVSDVPLPKTTRYDSNPKTEEEYLEGYLLGYREFLAGRANGSGPDVFNSDPIARARMFGWYDGREAAVGMAEPQRGTNRPVREGRSK